MACCVGFERDPRVWQRCLDAARDEMLAQGWVRHARKFSEVQHRRANRRYWSMAR